LPAHVKAQDVIDLIGEVKYNMYFSFAIVRNPWDWQVSLYSYMLKKTSHPQHTIVKSFKNFEDYVYWRCKEDVQFQKDFIYNMDGKLLVNYVGRFEHIDRDFKEICKRIGISAALPKINVSNTTAYQKFYNAETKRMIQKTFEPDISLFKYTFE
jgi:sulfotransferase famil protein